MELKVKDIRRLELKVKTLERENRQLKIKIKQIKRIIR